MMANQEGNVSYQEMKNCSISIVFNIALNIVLMFPASLGNGMIIIAILRSQNLQTPSYLLMTSLAFTDLLMGLVYHPLQIALNIYNFQGNVQGVCRIILFYVFFTVNLAFSSLLMVTCISIDRYLALTLRHRYNTLVTKKRVRLLILLVWITMFFLSFPATRESAFHSYYILGNCLGTALLLTTFVFYVKSFRALHLYTVQVQAQYPNPLAGNFDIVRYKKTLKTMLIVLACLLLSFMPLACSLIARVTPSSGKKVQILYLISLTLIGLNSSINPVVYIVRFADIRNACFEMFTNLVH